MKNIAFYAKSVKYISYALMPAIIVGFFIKWLTPEFSLSNPHIVGLFLSYTFDDYTTMTTTMPTMPFIHRLIGMCIDSVVAGLLLAILWLIASLMRKFENNEIFSASTVSIFTTLSKCAFYLALYTPINRMLLSLVITLHVTPHTLTASIGSADLCNILIFGILMVMTLLMQQATILQNEQNLTV